jgi:hypothetical protein
MIGTDIMVCHDDDDGGSVILSDVAYGRQTDKYISTILLNSLLQT